MQVDILWFGRDLLAAKFGVKRISMAAPQNWCIAIRRATRSPSGIATWWTNDCRLRGSKSRF
jgi:hypothetical protein